MSPEPRLTVVTGAAGFVGQAVARRMQQSGYRGSVRLVDRVAPPACGDFAVMQADLTGRADLAAAVDGADRVIHLASLPGGAAEADPRASRAINLSATLDLIDILAASAKPVRLVYASSIAVFGASFPDVVDDETPARPESTYGTHKAMVELALGDATRRGQIDAIALRLPGIVARPEGAFGLKSAFMSDIFWAIRAGEAYTVPLDKSATMWLMSAECCADNVIHAAGLVSHEAQPYALTLPALRVGFAALAASIAESGGDASAVRYAPDAAIRRAFGSYPPLRTRAADALGFRHDGDLDTLVRQGFAAAGASARSPTLSRTETENGADSDAPGHAA